MIKRVYSQPTSKLLVVRFGGAILNGSLIYGNNGQNVDYHDDDNIDDLGEF